MHPVPLLASVLEASVFAHTDRHSTSYVCVFLDVCWLGCRFVWIPARSGASVLRVYGPLLLYARVRAHWLRVHGEVILQPRQCALFHAECSFLLFQVRTRKKEQDRILLLW